MTSWVNLKQSVRAGRDILRACGITSSRIRKKSQNKQALSLSFGESGHHNINSVVINPQILESRMMALEKPQGHRQIEAHILHWSESTLCYTTCTERHKHWDNGSQNNHPIVVIEPAQPLVECSQQNVLTTILSLMPAKEWDQNKKTQSGFHCAWLTPSCGIRFLGVLGCWYNVQPSEGCSNTLGNWTSPGQALNHGSSKTKHIHESIHSLPPSLHPLANYFHLCSHSPSLPPLPTHMDPFTYILLMSC